MKVRKNECRFCGSIAHGYPCSYSTYATSRGGLHVEVGDDGHCIYCGSTSYGYTCSYNPGDDTDGSRFMYMVTAMKHQINASIVEVQIEVLDVPGHRLEDISFDKRNLYERAERSALSSFSPTEYIPFSFTYIEVHVIQFFVNCIPHSINKIIEFFFLSPSK